MKIKFTHERLEYFRNQGAKGGTKAANNMSDLKRKQRAKKAAVASWGKQKKEQGQ